MLPDWPLLTTFLVASFVLAITPGPGVFYIVTRSLAHGRRSGLGSVAGVAVGNLGNVIGASVGLAALFAISAVAFTVVKYAGAIYLIVLGLQRLRVAPSADGSVQIPHARLSHVVRDGAMVALLNPKTTLFFAAFLPQFIRADGRPVIQSVLLGAMFVGIAAVTDTVYAITAGAVAPRLARATGIRAAGRYLTGGAFIGLGVFTALAGSRGSR